MKTTYDINLCFAIFSTKKSITSIISFDCVGRKKQKLKKNEHGQKDGKINLKKCSGNYDFGTRRNRKNRIDCIGCVRQGEKDE